MKNKELTELINKMKKCYGVMDFYLAYNEVDLLLNHIEQLESNTDKVIKTLETLKGSARWERHLHEIDYMLDILKDNGQ